MGKVAQLEGKIFVIDQPDKEFTFRIYKLTKNQLNDSLATPKSIDNNFWQEQSILQTLIQHL
jgi:hypothetical protein